MIDAIVRELKVRSVDWQEKQMTTIYFGGGTPSILNREELSLILNTIRSLFPLEDGAEITLEANPEDIHAENLEMWKAAGINRLSIGLQTFRKSDLEWMNRAHSVEEAKNAVRLAQEAGFENLTVDLIYGLPDLRLEEWKAHVQTVIDMGVPHVSAYCLTVEGKTALHHRVKKGELQLPEDEQQAAQFLALVELLAHAGLEQYEISNFAKPGCESKHNSSYWRGTTYLGVGPSAHSYDGTNRRWNVANNRKYMDGVETGMQYYEEEQLSKEDRFNELLLTGLRTREGVDLNALDRELSRRSEFSENMENFIAQGWMVRRNDRIALSAEGKLRADFIAAELFAV